MIIVIAVIIVIVILLMMRRKSEYVVAEPNLVLYVNGSDESARLELQFRQKIMPRGNAAIIRHDAELQLKKNNQIYKGVREVQQQILDLISA